MISECLVVILLLSLVVFSYHAVAVQYQKLLQKSLTSLPTKVIVIEHSTIGDDNQ